MTWSAPTPEDFGALGDWNPVSRSGTDDTNALQSWLNYLSSHASGAVGLMNLVLPPKLYRYTSTLTLDASGVSIIGSGSGTSGLVYDGANTTIDTFIIGHDGGALINVYISGIRFCTNVAMTAGCLVRAKGLTDSTLFDVVISGQDHLYYANGTPYIGIWFQGVGYVCTGSFWVDGATKDNVIVSAHTGNLSNNGYPRTGFFLGQGKIGGAGDVGLRISGVGGVVNFGTDVISNGVNTQIDDTITDIITEQVMLMCTDDSSTIGSNIVVNTTQSNGMLIVKTWSGTAKVHGLHVISAPNWQIQIEGANFQNHLHGDAIRVDDATTWVDIGGCQFGNIPSGFAINPNVSGHKVSITFNEFGLNVPYPINGTYGGGIGRRAVAGYIAAINGYFYEGISWQPSPSGNDPYNNGDLNIQRISNTQVKIALRGSDGVVRTTTLNLS